MGQYIHVDLTTIHRHGAIHRHRTIHRCKQCIDIGKFIDVTTIYIDPDIDITRIHRHNTINRHRTIHRHNKYTVIDITTILFSETNVSFSLITSQV